ncbi:MAG TPA: SRPBCC domain-containing protein, partial [Chryseolinea sp.]|nr:SRPBCC domain-containing protein [Chryseolinea sp.]
KVWQALTVAEHFKKWWGPNGFTCPYSSMEAWKGGKYLNCMRAPDGTENWSTGVVQEIIPEKKLVITDSFSDSKGNIISAADVGMQGDWPMELMITFELKEADGATKLKLTHEGVPEEAHDQCVQGWNECFDKLEKNMK